MKKTVSFIIITAVSFLFFYCPPPGSGGGEDTYTVTYNGNGSTGGSVPSDPEDYTSGQTVTVLGNTRNLEIPGFTFSGWNTQADGNGITYTQGQTFTIGAADVTLYAVWIDSSIRVVIYNGNGNTGGMVPLDDTVYAEGDTVTVLGSGNLVMMRDGISLLFTGWNTAADGSGTEYEESDSFIIGTQNVTLYAQWSAVRAVGPAGGLIFYDKGNYDNGWRYLEAAPGDQGSKKWTAAGIYLAGTRGSACGLGETNTIIIVDSYQSGNCAAKLCNDLVLNGYDDWFLPSFNELIVMRNVLHLKGVGNFSGEYWSSSEHNNAEAWSVDFNSGQKSGNKDSYLKVRAVRAFCNAADPPTSLMVYVGPRGAEGESPLDLTRYENGDPITVSTNTGLLQYPGYSFRGWNTEVDGSGTDYAEGSTFTMGTSDIVLYAKWTDISFRVNYIPYGATSGTVPHDYTDYAEGDTVTVLGNTGDLKRINAGGVSYRFVCWNTEWDGSGSDYAEGSTFSMGKGDVFLYPRWVPYAVRDEGPAGGFIFYDKGSYSDGWRYLEASPVDHYWNHTSPWGCDGTVIIGADGTAVGTGKYNTQDIEQYCTTPETAADLCANFVYADYDDWFLPSKDELNLMYVELKQQNTGNFNINGFYWSSSECSAGFAWMQWFYSGAQFEEDKSNLNSVRPVRAF
jgi:uncharacterized repeat protein (TIGR02543 family)